MIAWCVLAAALIGCDGGGGGGAGDADGGAGGSGGSGGEVEGGGGGGEVDMRDVPYEGMVPELPEGATVDARDFFPMPDGAVWRYRRRPADPTMPGPVEQGGEAAVVATPGEDEFGEPVSEVVRSTVTIIDLEVEGEEVKVRQVIDETYLITPPSGQVGPKVRFKGMTVTEREVESGRFVRELDRTYFPPYTLISDAWQVGNFDTNLRGSDIRLMQDLTLRGDEEPRHIEGLINYRVETATRPETLIIEGAYREGVRKIEVFDDFSDTLTRTYWVQPGVGLVQWIFADTNNITFTLTESNVEAAARLPEE